MFYYWPSTCFLLYSNNSFHFESNIWTDRSFLYYNTTILHFHFSWFCFVCQRRGQFHSLHTCSPPALPVGRITALQALEFWKKYFEESGVTEPDLSSHYIVAHSLGGKTVRFLSSSFMLWCNVWVFFMCVFFVLFCFFCQIESLEQRKLTEFLSREKTEQIWKLCTKRLSRYSDHTSTVLHILSFIT